MNKPTYKAMNRYPGRTDCSSRVGCFFSCAKNRPPARIPLSKPLLVTHSLSRHPSASIAYPVRYSRTPKMAETGWDLHNVVAGATTNITTGRPRAILLSTGALNPPHRGHVRMIEQAKVRHLSPNPGRNPDRNPEFTALSTSIPSPCRLCHSIFVPQLRPALTRSDSL